MIRVAIVGATGYTGLELIRILLRHPNVQITHVTSRDPKSPHLADVHPSLRDRLDLNLAPLDVEQIGTQCDAVFCCLPHAASAEVILQLLKYDVRIVDFSADYRLTDQQTFEDWYGVKHPDPQRLGSVPYGIPELFESEIVDATLVANPGCFPSSALLPLAPLLKAGLIHDSPIIVDSKTGVSGAGRKSNLAFHYPECNESTKAYGVGTHRHMPEIDSVLKRYSDRSVECVFTPHLVSMDRGILSTLYVQTQDGVDADQAWNELDTFYKDQPFIRVTKSLPATKDVSGSNFSDIAVRQSRDTLVIVSALDNLIKGASGAAVQNFNLMFGFDQTTALL